MSATTTTPAAATVASLVEFYEALSPESVTRLHEFYAADAYFKDPFNEMRGVPAIERVFSHMYSQVADPRFVVLERVVAENGVLLVWTMHFRRPGGKGAAQVIRGASHLKFSEQGKVVWHRDYWDAAEELYAKLPVIGWLMRFLKGRLAA